MNNKKILLIGGGGHCKSVIDVLEEENNYSEIGIIDMSDKIDTLILNYPIIGCDEDLKDLFEEGYKEAIITLGSIGSFDKREKIYKKLKKIGFTLTNIISNSAIVSKHIKIGEGNFIGKGVIINVDSTIGNNTIINSGSIIEHDCNISSFVHIAPGCVLSGQVNVGYGTHIGTNGTVIQNVEIGKNSLVGAGSVVVSEVEENVVAYGVPCKEMKKR